MWINSRVGIANANAILQTPWEYLDDDTQSTLSLFLHISFRFFLPLLRSLHISFHSYSDFAHFNNMCCAARLKIWKIENMQVDDPCQLYFRYVFFFSFSFSLLFDLVFVDWVDSIPFLPSQAMSGFSALICNRWYSFIVANLFAVALCSQMNVPLIKFRLNSNFIDDRQAILFIHFQILSTANWETGIQFETDNDNNNNNNKQKSFGFWMNATKASTCLTKNQAKCSEREKKEKLQFFWSYNVTVCLKTYLFNTI